MHFAGIYKLVVNSSLLRYLKRKVYNWCVLLVLDFGAED